MFSRLNLLRKLRSREPIAEAAIMSSMAHAVVVLDANNRVNYLNPAAEALCGTNAAAATGQPIKKISAPLAEALQKAAGSNQVRVEYQVGEHDQIHYYEAHVSSLAGQQGQTGGWVAVINDITEQKMLSMAQAKSMRFQILFDKSPDAVVLLDPHAPDVSWPIVDCNPAFCQMNGYDRDELIGQSIDILHKKPDSPANRANFFQRLHQEGTVVGTIAHRRKDGSIYYIQYVTSLVTFEGREFVLGIDRDITERIQTEEALIQHVSRLELINQVGRDLTAELSLEFLLAKAANLIQASFGYPHVGLFLLDREREELAMKARAGSYAALFPPDHHLRLSEGINGWVARNGKRLLIGDVRKEPRYYNPFPEQLILSELSVPIKWGDEVVGVLDIQSDQLDAFGKSDILVLETLADQLAAGIQNARLFEKTQQALIELVEAEEAVRAERDRAQQYLDVAGAIIVALDSDQRATLINRKGCEVLGYEPHEIIGQNWIDIAIPEDNRQRVKQGFQKFMAGEIELVEQAESPVVTRQGDERIVDWQNALLQDDDGQIIGTLSSGVDVTERRRAEQALRESEMQYRIVTEQNLAGVYIIQDGKFRYVNPALARILGYPPDEVIDRMGPKDVAHPDDLPNVMETVRQRIDGEIDEAQYELRIQRPSGEIINCEVLGRRVMYEGRPAVLGTLLDITRRIQVEEALLQHIGQLELINQVSREITAELTPDVLLAKAANLIQESFGYPHVGLFLLDRECEELVMKARAGSYAALFPPDHRLKLDAGINGWVATNGKRLLIGDVRKEPRYYNPFPEQLILSELSVPIKWGDEVIGVLDVQSDQLDAFGKNDVLVLETLADQLATAIQNARLFEQIQQTLVELVEAEEAVRAERDRAQQYLDVAGAIIVALDRDQRVILINRKGCEILGYDQQAITGQNWFDMAVPEHDRARIRTIFKQLMGGAVDQYERVENAILTRQDGERIIDWQNALLQDDDGQIIGTLSSGIDVTERRRAEAAEREQRILAETLRDNAAIINSTLDLGDVLQRVLNNVARVVPHDSADLLLVKDGIARITRTKGRNRFASGEVRQSLRLPVETTANLKQMVKTQKGMVISDISRDPNWTHLVTGGWARGYVSAPIMLEGKIMGFLSAFSMEPDAYTSSDAERLQAFADQAAIAIQNAQLFEQMNRYAAELEDSNEKLAAYGHMIAHDLKNPLSSLLMGFEVILVESDSLSHTGQKFVRQSQKLVVNMSRSIDGLLHFAELRDDQGEIEEVDMSAVVEDVLAQLMKLIIDRGVRIDVAPDLPDAMGHTPWVEEVLANLISNAVKYIGQDNPDPLIMIRGSLQGDWVRFEIEDNGVGIAPEDQEQLFEAFTRFHKGEASGHGLGLSIVKSIIHKLNGELGVESVLGEGSTFWFTLPAPPP